MSLYEQLVARSRAFPVPFPTSANRIESIVGAAASGSVSNVDLKPLSRGQVLLTIEDDARNTRVLVHSSVLGLVGDFLSHKIQHGSPAEHQLYSSMDSAQFIKRLITNRPLSFLNRFDFTLLRDGRQLSRGLAPWKAWDLVGTEQTLAAESGSPLAALRLQDYLSYDEMQISALLGVSTPTFFINNGNRHNRAQLGESGTYEPHGVYLALVGPRFERPGRMEDEWIIAYPPGVLRQAAQELPARLVESEEAKESRRRMWMHFYDVDTLPVPFVSAPGAPAPEGWAKIHPELGPAFFSIVLYKRRIRVTAEIMLMEADLRAQAANRKAYVHVVGLGLGVWMIHPLQTRWYLEVFADVLDDMRLPHIDTVDFSWFRGYDACGNTESGHFTTGCKSGNRIRIVFSERNPADRLERGSDLLLVATYAWDGNAFPGNEYWVCSLNGSGDPAAACCSTIPQLQNPMVNDFAGRIACLGADLDGKPTCSMISTG